MAERLAATLEDCGWSVFWDRRIPAGRRFDEFIGEQLEAARCVIVLWSASSIRSEWVIEEAADAKDQNLLAPALIDAVRPPFGFRHRQCADLIGWSPGASHPGLEQLVEDIARIAGLPQKSRTNEAKRIAEAERQRGEAEAKRIAEAERQRRRGRGQAHSRGRAPARRGRGQAHSRGRAPARRGRGQAHSRGRAPARRGRGQAHSRGRGATGRPAGACLRPRKTHAQHRSRLGPAGWSYGFAPADADRSGDCRDRDGDCRDRVHLADPIRAGTRGIDIHAITA